VRSSTGCAKPTVENFDFTVLYEDLAAQQLIIYSGKLSQTASFRIGTIGKIDTDDVHRLLNALRDFLQ